MSKHIGEWISILIGNFFVAIAVACFILPNHILTGGVAGVSVALEKIIPIDPVWMINGLTVGLFLVGAVVLGKGFALKSVISAICYPLFVTFCSYIVDTFYPEAFIMPDYLASIYSGIISGIGLGIVFRVNASTGGMDIPALILHKVFHIPSGTAVSIIDGLTVILGMATHGLVPALVGILSVFVSGQTINRVVMFGSQSAKEILVISNKWKEIRTYLLQTVDRGVTILEGSGGYTAQSRPVLMCVINKSQYPPIVGRIQEIDPQAFVVTSDVNEVHGPGFTLEKHAG